MLIEKELADLLLTEWATTWSGSWELKADRGLVCCDSRDDGKELDAAERLNWAKSCYLKILCCGSGPGKTFTTLKHSFDLLWVTIEKYTNAFQKESELASFCLLVSVSEHFLSLFIFIKLLLHEALSDWSPVLGLYGEVFLLAITNLTPFIISYQFHGHIWKISSAIINYGQLN